MKLAADLREYLAREAFVNGTRMQSEGVLGNLELSLYYYSAVFGAVQRVVNMQFDRHLLLVLWVFAQSHQSIANRLAIMRQNPGRDDPITISPKVMPTLADAVLEFGRRIGTGKDEYVDILENVAAAAYSTGGNGYYLMDTGVLEL